MCKCGCQIIDERLLVGFDQRTPLAKIDTPVIIAFAENATDVGQRAPSARMSGEKLLN